MIPSPLPEWNGPLNSPEGQNMSDVKIEIEGDSDAAVALALLRMIAVAEGKEEDGDRGWYLETYSACLAVVRDADILDLDEDEDEEEDGGEEDAEPAADAPAEAEPAKV
jgi:hypothetical protein